MRSLAIEGASVRFGAVEALCGVDLDVREGETLMLVGPNGAGKSTLFKVLLGLVRPDAGALVVDGAARSPDRALRARLGYLPEAVAFSDNLTGREVLGFFARARRVSRTRVEEVLALVGLTAAARRPVRGYSRGMRQRLGLGQAILAEPELLILDEPTGGLDQQGLSVLWSVLAEWRREGRMVLLSAHDLALLERRIDRMCVLRAGRVLATDTPDALRLRAALPHRVHFELAEGANGEARELARAVEAVVPREVHHEGLRLRAEVPPEALLRVMDLSAQHRSAIVGLRVEEAPLDLVYERLLGEP